VGLHDEIFQGGTPVLAGVDAGSTYCYLLADSGDRERPIRSIMNTDSGDHEHPIALA
jgi:hypothetical protein